MEGYSVTEAASVLGVPTERVWELLARGVLSGAPDGESGMRVFLQPRPAPAPSPLDHAASQPAGAARPEVAGEVSPFRELLTEFRNLTERYGQALLALGEARGEVATLRSRVDLLEARIDLRLPPPAPTAWPDPRREPMPDARSSGESPTLAPPLDEDEDHEHEPRRRRRKPRATENFAEALARAEDPTAPELRPAGEPGSERGPARSNISQATAAPVGEVALPREVPAAEPIDLAPEGAPTADVSAATETPGATGAPASRVRPVPASPTAEAERQPPAESRHAIEGDAAAGPEPAPVPDRGADPAALAVTQPAAGADAEPAAAATAELAADPPPPADTPPAADAHPAADGEAVGDAEPVDNPADEAEVVPLRAGPEAAEAEPRAIAAEPPPVSVEPRAGDPDSAPLPAAAAADTAVVDDRPPISWDPERYTVEVAEPDWFEAEEVAPGGSAQHAAEPTPPPVWAEPEMSEAAAQEAAPGDAAEAGGAAADLVPSAEGPEPSTPSSMAPGDETATIAPPRERRDVPSAAAPVPWPDAGASRGSDEETMLWFGRAPEPDAAESPGADEMEVVGNAARPSIPSGQPAGLPGGPELHEALSALEALARGAPPPAKAAPADAPGWPREPGMGSPEASPAAAVPAPAQLTPPPMPAPAPEPDAPTPATRAYRRLRRIFPG